MHPHEVFGTLGCGNVWRMLVAQQCPAAGECLRQWLHCWRWPHALHIPRSAPCALAIAKMMGNPKCRLKLIFQIYPHTSWILYVHYIIIYTYSHIIFQCCDCKNECSRSANWVGSQTGLPQYSNPKVLSRSLCPGFRAKVFHFRASIVWISHLHGCFRDCLFWRHFVLRAQNEYWHIGVFDAVELALA